MRYPTIWITVFIAVVCCLPAGPAGAQDDAAENLDEIMEGFDDEAFGVEGTQNQDAPLTESDILQGFEEEAPAKDLPAAAQSPGITPLRLNGELAFTAVYNVSADANEPWRGVSMLRPELELTLKYKFSEQWRFQVGARGFYDAIYSIEGRDEYTSQVRDEYEKELELKDTFIQGSLTDHLDIKLGRQIVPWGTLDNLRVTDVLNPLDLRLPGLTDIDDLRLPVAMAKLDYYWGNWDLSAMVIPEVRFSQTPVYGSDFYPYAELPPAEEIPADGVDDAQYAAALTGVFQGWDLGFYGASLYADQAYGEPLAGAASPQMVGRHARLKMAGAAANIALGNWLVKAETAWWDGLRYTHTPGGEHERLDLGLGLEYSGFSETTLSLEAALRHLFDFTATLEQPPDSLRENQVQWALRFVRDFLNDTLTLNLLAGSFGQKIEDGMFERLDAEYDLTDSVSIRGGIVMYQTGSTGRYQEVDGLDRLFLVCKYSF